MEVSKDQSRTWDVIALAVGVIYFVWYALGFPGAMYIGAFLHPLYRVLRERLGVLSNSVAQPAVVTENQQHDQVAPSGARMEENEIQNIRWVVQEIVRYVEPRKEL